MNSKFCSTCFTGIFLVHVHEVGKILGFTYREFWPHGGMNAPNGIYPDAFAFSTPRTACFQFCRKIRIFVAMQCNRNNTASSQKCWERNRGPCSKAREYDSWTVVQPCMWLKEEPNQFSMGQTAQSVTCSIMEKPLTGLDECPRILLSCFKARNSGEHEGITRHGVVHNHGRRGRLLRH